MCIQICVLKYSVLTENLKYSKAKVSGDDCHQKDSFLLKVPKRRRHTILGGHTRGSTKVIHWVEGEVGAVSGFSCFLRKEGVD